MAADAAVEPDPQIPDALGLVPAPPALPPFGARRGYPSPALIAGWRAAHRAAAIEAPSRPATRGLDDVQRWAEQDFARWLSTRRDAVLDAERVLSRVAADADPHERAVAAALVGWLYDTFAYELTHVAVIPMEIHEDVELLGIYATVTTDAARPLLSTAADRFARCAGIPTSEGWWAPWLRYCREREPVLRRAPARLDPALVRARLAAPSSAVSGAGPAEITLPALARSRSPRPPRAQRDLVRSLEPLTTLALELAAEDDASDALTAFRETDAAAWAAGPRATLERLRADLEGVDLESTGDRAALLHSLEPDFVELLTSSLTLEDDGSACWVGRAAALGLMTVLHQRARRAHAEAARLEDAARAQRAERMRARRARADGLAALEGDELVRSALLVLTGEIEDASAATLLEALRAYAAAGDVVTLEAVRRAAVSVARAPSPLVAEPPSAALAAEATRLRRLHGALMGPPRAGAVALRRALADELLTPPRFPHGNDLHALVERCE